MKNLSKLKRQNIEKNIVIGKQAVKSSNHEMYDIHFIINQIKAEAK